MKINYYLSLLLFIYPLNVLSDNNILIQSTTSTRDSGFYEYIIPFFYNKHKINVSVVSVGTGQAIKNASRCDGDLLIVHAMELEKKFINNGFGVLRNNLMHNNFVIIGPKNDPANIYNSTNISEVFYKLYNTKHKFISRGDDSGTHMKEKKIWGLAQINTAKLDNNWYLESGQGMGATLNITIGLNAYTISDNATWARFNNKNSHKILFDKDKSLHNQYGIIKINPKICPDLNHNNANIFYNWILSNEGQTLIDQFTINGINVFNGNFIDN